MRLNAHRSGYTSPQTFALAFWTSFGRVLSALYRHLAAQKRILWTDSETYVEWIDIFARRFGTVHS